jgi:hypothetical protein
LYALSGEGVFKPVKRTPTFLIKRLRGTETMRSHFGLMQGLQRPLRVETMKLDVVGKLLEFELE